MAGNMFVSGELAEQLSNSRERDWEQQKRARRTFMMKGMTAYSITTWLPMKSKQLSTKHWNALVRMRSDSAWRGSDATGRRQRRERCACGEIGACCEA